MKTKSISKLLGVTQEVLAQILGVSRSQLSLYEIGKRDLPAQSKLKLSIILEQFNAKNESSVNKTSDIASSKLVEKSIIEELLLINQKNTILVEKKIEAIRVKNESLFATKHLIAILENINTNSDKKSIRLLKQKNNLNSNTAFLKNLLPLKIKLEVLQQEEKVLQKYLNQATKT